jgi:hypothetical protein
MQGTKVHFIPKALLTSAPEYMLLFQDPLSQGSPRRSIPEIAWRPEPRARRSHQKYLEPLYVDLVFGKDYVASLPFSI